MFQRFFRNSTLYLSIVVFLCLVAVCIQLIGCDSSAKNAALKVQGEEKASIKIAVVGPQSGDLASYGVPIARAAQLVVERRNALCGISGRPIELVVEDDGCKPELATSAATKVLEKGVQAVLGHSCSGATKAALGIYNNAKIVAVSPSATNPALTQSGNYPNFFRTIAADDTQAQVEVEFALGNLHLSKLAVLHDKSDYGKDFAEFIKEFIEADRRGEVVMYEGISPDDTDYSSVINTISRSGAKAVIFGGYHPAASKLVSQMRKKNMYTTFIAGDGVKDDAFIKAAGRYAENVYATGPTDTSQNPIAIEAIEAHKAKFGEDPGAFFLNAYAATLVLVNAIEKSCSTRYKDVIDILRNEWVATPLGILKFDERGDAIGVGFSVYQVRDGKYIEVPR